MREVPLVPDREAAEKPPHPPPSAALQAARRLVSRELERSGTSDPSPDHLVSALHRACTLVVANLRESMGDDGCDALFGRAIARAETLHPVLGQLREPKASGISRPQLLDAVGANRAAAQTAIEALLTTLIDILARLIGEDMAIRIIDRDAELDTPSPDTSGAAS